MVRLGGVSGVGGRLLRRLVRRNEEGGKDGTRLGKDAFEWW